MRKEGVSWQGELEALLPWVSPWGEASRGSEASETVGYPNKAKMSRTQSGLLFYQCNTTLRGKVLKNKLTDPEIG